MYVCMYVCVYYIYIYRYMCIYIYAYVYMPHNSFRGLQFGLQIELRWSGSKNSAQGPFSVNA